MTKHKYEHQHSRIPDQAISDVRVPYWHRAHRDWRFIAVVLLMLFAVGVYLATGDLAWTNHGHVMPLVVNGQ